MDSKDILKKSYSLKEYLLNTNNKSSKGDIFKALNSISHIVADSSKLDASQGICLAVPARTMNDIDFNRYEKHEFSYSNTEIFNGNVTDTKKLNFFYTNYMQQTPFTVVEYDRQ